MLHKQLQNKSMNINLELLEELLTVSNQDFNTHVGLFII